MSIQTKANLVINIKHVNNARNKQFGGEGEGGDHMSQTHSFSPLGQFYYYEVLTVSYSLKNGFCQKS